MCALWAWSYHNVDIVTFASHSLHRDGSGGGGVFIESFRLEVGKGNWRNRVSPIAHSVSDYAKYYRAGTGQQPVWRWQSVPYVDRRELVKRVWGPDLNRLWPQSSPAWRTRMTYSSVDYSTLAEKLIGRRLWFPYWIALVMTALLPMARLLLFLRQSRRSNLGLCAARGYDLRATPDRCPECGAAPVPLDV
ncbi:MAG TPA: hypothetical protein VFC78_02155 [Tepidisphaeraceae bacterium]|nr:hypothetical protein [Tepidisphaeraceae bacterium]